MNINNNKDIYKCFLLSEVALSAIGAFLLITQTGCSQQASRWAMKEDKKSANSNRNNDKDKSKKQISLNKNQTNVKQKIWTRARYGPEQSEESKATCYPKRNF